MIAVAVQVLWIIASYLQCGTCSPFVSLPVASQIPPLAYAGQEYKFQFAESTFSSAYPLTYTLLSTVPWLQLDSESRELRGHVPAGFHGTFEANITASSFDGSSTDYVVLLATNGSAFQTHGTSPDDLINSPDVPGNGRGGYLLLYSQVFKLPIPKKLFGIQQSEGEGVVYYTMSSDGTPLPNWLQFNNVGDDDNVYLSGTAPPPFSPIAPPMPYPIKIVAATVAGYETSRVSMDLIVGPKNFYFKMIWMDLEVDRDAEIDIRVPALISGDTVVPFGSPILRKINLTGPNWLKFGKSTGKLTGKAPKDFAPHNATCTLEAVDINGDAASTTFQIRLVDDLSSNVAIGTEDLFAVAKLPTVNATEGTTFTHELSPTIFEYYDLDLNVTLSPRVVSKWLRFDRSRLLFFGKVPKKLAYSVVTVNLTATLLKQSFTSYRSFKITILPNNATRSPPRPHHPDSHHSSGAFSIKQRNILLISIFSILLFIILMLCAIYAYAHRRRMRRKLSAMSCLCTGQAEPDDGGNHNSVLVPAKRPDGHSAWLPSDQVLDQQRKQSSSISHGTLPMRHAFSFPTAKEHGKHRPSIPKKDSGILPRVFRDDYQKHRGKFTLSPKIDETDDDTTCGRTLSSKCTTPSPSPNPGGLSPFPSTKQRQLIPRADTLRLKARGSGWPDFGRDIFNKEEATTEPRSGSSLGNRASIRLVDDRPTNIGFELEVARSLSRCSSTENWVAAEGHQSTRKAKPYIIRTDADGELTSDEPASSSSPASTSSFGTCRSGSDGERDGNQTSTRNWQGLEPGRKRSEISKTWPSKSTNAGDPTQEQMGRYGHEFEDFDGEYDGAFATGRRSRRSSRRISSRQFLPQPDEPQSGSVPIYQMFARRISSLSRTVKSDNGPGKGDISASEAGFDFNFARASAEGGNFKGGGNDRAGAINHERNDENGNDDTLSEEARTARLVEIARGTRLATMSSPSTQSKSNRDRRIPEESEQDQFSSDDNETAFL